MRSALFFGIGRQEFGLTNSSSDRLLDFAIDLQRILRFANRICEV